MFLGQPRVKQAPSATGCCRLYNSSYTADFVFADGRQNIRLRDKKIINEVTSVTSLSDPGSNDYTEARQRIMNYQAVMHALGYLIGGWLEGLFAGGNGVGGGPTKVLSTVLVDTEEFDSYRGDAELPGAGLGNPTNRFFIFGVEQ